MIDLAPIWDWFRTLHATTGIKLTIFYDAFDRARFANGFLTSLRLMGVCLVASVALGGWGAGLRSALAAAGGYLAFWAIAFAYRRTRGVEGLGQGDWKLAAMLGAFLGWERMLLTVLFASVLGTVVGLALIVARGRSSQHPLPLGTFLGLAGVVVLFIGQPLVDWYGRLLRG